MNKVELKKIMQLYKGYVWVSSLPPHLSCCLSEEQMNELLQDKGYLVRNTYDFDTDKETFFWYVIKDSFGGMDELSSRTRNKVRRSLKTYDIKLVSSEEILRVGLEIFQSAQLHYKVHCEPITKQDFEQRINDCVDKGNTDFWCVYEKSTNKAIALSINTLFNDCCEYNTLKANPQYLNSTYPFYGLIYEMNRYYLDTLNMKYVNDGSRSITEHSNIQGFLVDQFKFRKAYCELQIKYNRWLNIAVKVLFPFRKLIPFQKVKAIMNMESFKRGKL